MQQNDKSILDLIFENWHCCQEKLRGCVAPLVDEQLALLLARGM